MKKNILNKILLIMFIVLFAFSIKTYAATSISISTSKSSVKPGESFTVTVSAVGAGPVKATVSNGSGGKEDFLDNNSFSFTCTAGSSGSVTIYASGTLGDYATGEDTNPSTSKTIPIEQPSSNTGGSTGNSNSGGTTTTTPSTGGNATTTKPTEEKKSNDSSLKALVVEGYELYPEFNADTHEYNIRVTNDITKLTIKPTVNHEKASYQIQGATEELEVGKNVITVVVTAEDGSTTNYVINVTRNRENLSVENIKFFYTDENGQKQELVITPEFSADVLEYDLGTISYLVSKLDVDVLANFEEAQIEIIGNENLTEGENIITITVTMPSENEEETDEVLTYKVKVNKDAEPVVTFVGKIQNWFKGTTGTVGTWFNENLNEVLVGALGVACIALAGLSVYIVVDYKKYKLMVQKIAELTKLNNTATIETNEIANRKNKKEPETKPRGRHF